MKKLLTTFLLAFVISSFVASAQVFNYSDPIIEYDPNNPPSTPPTGVIGKWVRTSAVNWNTNKWKSYIINGIPFRLRFPNNYDPNRAESYPMVVLLHGLGFGNGTIYMNDQHLNNSGAKAYEDAINQGKFDGFVLSPQATFGWFSTPHMSAVKSIINQASSEVNLNVNRVSINGRSGGSQTVWLFIQDAPMTYASALPMAGINSGSVSDIDSYKYMPVWIFQGERDPSPAPWDTERFIDQIVAKKGNVTYTKFKNSGHGIFNKGYAEPDYWPFLMRVNKANPAVMTGEYLNVFENNGKWIYEFVEQTEPCPGDAVNVKLGLTAGFNAYEWRKDGELIVGENSNEYTVTEVGTYEARFRRGANWSEWSPRPVEVRFKAVTVTPDIRLQDNASRVIPALDGSESVFLELPQGYADYEWRRVSDNALVGSNRVYEATIPGEYRAKVTENFGCTSNFSNVFKVVDALGADGPEAALGFNGFATSKTNIKLIWSIDPNDPSPATGFEIYRAASETGPYEFVTLVGASSIEYIDGDLAPDTDYFYKIRSINENGASEGVGSPRIRTLVDALSPTAPTNLVLSDITPFSASLSWDAATDDVGIYRYDVYRDGIKTLTVEDTEATVYNLQSNRLYKFTVKARDITGNESAFSNRVVGATSMSNTSLANLKFENNLLDASAGNTQSAISGNVSFSTTEKTEGSASIQFSGSGFVDLDRNNAFIHSEVSNRSIAFWFKQLDNTGIQDLFDEGGSTNGLTLRINNGVLEFAVRDARNQQTIATTVTTDTWHHAAAVYNNNSISLYLDGNEVASNTSLPYSTISAHGDGGGIGATNGSNAFGQNSNGFIGFVDDLYVFGTSLTPAQISSLMDLEAVVVLPDEEVLAPQNITATAISFDKVDLSWDDMSDNETHFQIYRAKSGSDPVPVAIVEANVTSYADEGLEAETSYEYGVVALSEYNQSANTVVAVSALYNSKFEDNFQDNSGNNVSIQSSGNISYSTEAQQGEKSIYFNGSSLLNLDNGNQFIHNQFTERSVAFWFKSEDAGGTQDIYDEGGSTNGIGIRLIGNEIQLTTQNRHAIFSVQSAIDRAQWNHVMGVFASGELRLYINGVLVAERSDLSYSAVDNHGDAGGLGGTNGSNAFDSNSANFKGLVDDFYIFGTDMGTQAQQVMNLATPSFRATTFPLPEPPVAIDDLQISANDYESITLTFTDNAENEDYFRVLRAINQPTNFQEVETIAAQSGQAISFKDEDILSNIVYYYKIVATNAGGSTESNQVSGKTQNRIPSLSSLPENLTMRFNTDYELQIQANDEDGDELVITGDALPEFAQLTDYGDGRALLLFSPTEEHLSEQSYDGIIVLVDDGNGGTSSDTLSLIVNGNNLPEISEIAPVNLNEQEQLTLNIIASDVEGAEDLAWEWDLPLFAELTVGIDGSAVLVVAPTYSDHGSYEASINVTDLDGASASVPFTITVNDVDPNETYLVNFRSSTDANSPWNNISSGGTHVLTNSEGASSGVQFVWQTTAWNAWNDGAQASDNSGVFPNSVLKDYYYFGIFGAPETVSFKITGLEPSQAYNYSFLSSSIWSNVPDNGTTLYTIDGVTKGVYVQGNTQNVASFENILADANGEILVTLAKGANTPVGYMNGLSFSTIVGADQIPSPARDLKADIANSAVSLSWIDAPFNEDGYKVYKSEDQGVSFIEIATLSKDSEEFIDVDVVQGVTYQYGVSAYNGAGESDLSNFASVLMPNTPPSVVITGERSIEINTTTTLDVNIADLPLNEWTLAIADLPPFASFTEDLEGGVITFNPSLTDLGEYDFSVVATDDGGLLTSELVSITVAENALYIVGVNFTRYTSQTGSWNNTLANPTNGASFNNLIDQSGSSTTVDLTLTSNFAGAFNEGAQTGDDSGVVPDNVLREYYYWGIYGAPNTVSMRVSGLDITKKYSFEFVGSSAFRSAEVTDNGSTIYKIGNVEKVLDVDGNTGKSVSITDVVPDSNGDVIITMLKGSGAAVGYINALKISAFETDPSIFNPQDLMASASSASEIMLSWSDKSFDETGFEIARSENKTSGFSVIGTTAADVSTFVDSNLSAGNLYYYKVRAIKSEGYSNYTNTASAGTIAFYVNVNVNGVSTYDQAIPWNNLSSLAQTGDVFTGFKTSSGNESGIAMEVIQGMEGANDWGPTTGNDSGIYPDNVLQSFYWNNLLTDPGQYKLYGLDLSYNYNISFFGSIETPYNIATEFSIDGKTVINYQKDNLTTAVSIDGVSPSDDGTITFTVKENGNSRWAIFNAFVIEAYPVDNTSVFARKSDVPLAKPPYITDEVVYGLRKAELSYYPNPFRDQLTINIDNAPNAEAQIKLMDINGNTIVNHSILLSSLNNEVILSEELQNLKAGLYVVMVTVGDELHVSKIVKK